MPRLLAAIARARRFLQQRQTKPGDLIWVLLPMGFEAVAIFFACADLGGIFLAADPAWRQAELSWLMKQAPPAVAIAPSGEAERWRKAGLTPEHMVFGDRKGWAEAGDGADSAIEAWPPDQAVACVGDFRFHRSPKDRCTDSRWDGRKCPIRFRGVSDRPTPPDVGLGAPPPWVGL